MLASMNKYEENQRFSLEANFDLLYDGKKLLDEKELALLKNHRTTDSKGGRPALAEIDVRFRTLTGSSAVDGDGSLSKSCLNAMSIFEIKSHLSREQLVHRWESPSVAADSIVVKDGKLLLIKRRKDPYKGYYALPGGILDPHETLEECAVRELFEETGLKGNVLGLLTVFSDPKRDPRVRMVSAIFVVGHISGELKAGDDASDASFIDIDRLPGLAYDHDTAIEKFRASRYFTRQE